MNATFSTGLVLYGPPAVGKSTVTDALTALDPRFALFPVVKAGPGRTMGYAMITGDEFAERAAAGDFVFAWERYDAQYAISASALTRFADEGLVPVVHLGSVAAVQAVTAVPSQHWTVVQLWAGRDVCEDRARRRGTGDVAARMIAYDQTAKLVNDAVELTLDTSLTSPAGAAQAIRAVISRRT
ncbi:kinase [Streptomyces sp. WAC 05977]|nr:kinase [Streptomyces sp. WAC 05977]